MSHQFPIPLDHFCHILTQIRAQQGYLIDLADDGQTLRLKLKADGTPIDADTALISQTIIDVVIKAEQPVITRNAMTDRRFARDRNVMRFRIRSVICVPLWHEGRIVSLVYVEHRAKRGQFNRNQVPLLEALGEPSAQQAEAQSPELRPAEKEALVQAAPSQEEKSEQAKSPHSRYILHEQLGRGGMGMVHRATDRLTGEIVALKQVYLSQEKRAFLSSMVTVTQRNLRFALAQEFQIVAGMRHPHIISVLDYGFGLDQQPYFTMTYLPETQTFLDAGKGLDEAGKLDLLRQLLQALTYLHRRGVIHRDLKPSNVLVVEQRVQVLDFGLSISQETTLTSAGGTLLYMAPELFDSQAASLASDLYAVGVMAYQLFAGRHPFDTTSYAFVDQVLYDAPDLTILELNDALAEVIARLLAKKPADRYLSAEACLRAIQAALRATIPAESTAIRESYLQAATFVGREAEMAQLQAALTAAKEGQGSVWLIGGESGVGKSRLIEEFRTHALVSGWQVVTGQAVAEGGVPYQLWREIVRRLLLNTQLSDLEAGILIQVAPDIEHLLARPIPQPPELHGEAGQLRLVLTLVSIIQRQRQPTLLLVEDLQWAQESLAPLQQVLKVDGQMTALMVVGTYRNDERPNLPEILAGSQGFVLGRLAEAQIAQLSQAMLGKEASTPRIVSLLRQETEGNTFFIVEVMRALAEEAGQLDEIGEMTLPVGVFTSGMQHLLQRRVQRTAEQDQPLLKLAAIAGRQLDVNLLQVLAPETKIAAWLQRSLDAAILAVADGQWMFAHDKLREAILAGLVAETQQGLHRQVAEAIEQLYPDHKNYHQILLEHWHQAGNQDKEIHYLTAVAQYMIDITADYNEAHRLLARGLPNLSVDDARRVTLLNLWSEAYCHQGSYDQAQAQAQQAQVLAQKINDLSGLAASLNNMGNVAYAKGDYKIARKNFSEMLDYSQSYDDQKGILTALFGLAKVTFRQGFYSESYDYSEQGLEISQALGHQVSVARLFNNLGVAADLQGDLEQARRHYLEGLEMSQILGDQTNIQSTLANLGVLEKSLGNYEQARAYLKKSLSICRAIGEQLGIAITLENLGGVARLQGDYEQASDYLGQSMAISEAIGDQLGVATCHTVAGFLYLKRQDNRAQASFKNALMLSQAIQATPLMLEIMVGYAWVYLEQGELIRAGRLAGLAQHHPAHEIEVQLWLDELNPRLNAALSLSELETAMEEGRTLALDVVVAELLNEF